MDQQLQLLIGLAVFLVICYFVYKYYYPSASTSSTSSSFDSIPLSSNDPTTYGKSYTPGISGVVRKGDNTIKQDIPLPPDKKKWDQVKLHPEEIMMEAINQEVTAGRDNRHYDDQSNTVTANPDINYDDYVRDLNIDENTKENHDKYVRMVIPFGTVAGSVDRDWEQQEYLHWSGLRRPQATIQSDPWQVTEADPTDLAKNRSFDFNGSNPMKAISYDPVTGRQTVDVNQLDKSLHT